MHDHNTGSVYYSPHYVKKYTTMFEHRFLLLKNDHLFKNSPPPPPNDNQRVCDHNAMLAFPQEQISHYTMHWSTPGHPLPPKMSNWVFILLFRLS